MTPAPTLGSVAVDIIEALAPHAAFDTENGYAFAHFAQAVGLMLQPVDDLIRDTDTHPGWAPLVSVDLAPDDGLAFLAQLVGVRLTQGAPADVQRDEIRVVDGQRRGRPAAFREKTRATLTGTRTVRLLERTSSAYAFTAVTRTAETPDPDATLAAMTAAKPAGLVLTHVISDAPVIDEGALTIDEVTATIDAATVADVT